MKNYAIDVPSKPSSKPICFQVSELLQKYKSNTPCISIPKTETTYTELFESVATEHNNSFEQPNKDQQDQQQKLSVYQSGQDTSLGSIKESMDKPKCSDNDVILQQHYTSSVFKYLQQITNLTEQTNKNIEKSAHFPQPEKGSIKTPTQKYGQRFTNTRSKENLTINRKSTTSNKSFITNKSFEKQLQPKKPLLKQPSRSITPQQQKSPFRAKENIVQNRPSNRGCIKTESNSNLGYDYSSQTSRKSKTPLRNNGQSIIKVDLMKCPTQRVVPNKSLVGEQKKQNLQVELSLKNLLRKN